MRTVKAHGGDFHALQNAVKDEAFAKQWTDFSERVKDMERDFCVQRNNFHDIILQSMANFTSLSEYQIDEARVEKDRENLVFYEVNPIVEKNKSSH
jgi:hypothetical protein